MGSNPTSSASATSRFAQHDHCWSALGPLPVGERGCPGLLQPVSQGLQLRGKQVPVGIQGDARGRMPELRLYGLHASALGDKQRRAGVPQVINESRP